MWFCNFSADLVHTLPNHQVAAVHIHRTGHLHGVAHLVDVHHTVDPAVDPAVDPVVDPVAAHETGRVLEIALDTVVDNRIANQMNVFFLVLLKAIKDSALCYQAAFDLMNRHEAQWFNFILMLNTRVSLALGLVRQQMAPLGQIVFNQVFL